MTVYHQYGTYFASKWQVMGLSPDRDKSDS